jgi:hypothetical protein
MLGEKGTGVVFGMVLTMRVFFSVDLGNGRATPSPSRGQSPHTMPRFRYTRMSWLGRPVSALVQRPCRSDPHGRIFRIQIGNQPLDILGHL